MRKPIHQWKRALLPGCLLLLQALSVFAQAPFKNAISARVRQSKATRSAGLPNQSFRRVWIRWESEQPQRLAGSIRLNDGHIINHACLGAQGDEAATIHATPDEITIFTTSVQKTGGVLIDTSINADTSLSLELQAQRGGGQAELIELPLQQIAVGTQQTVKVPGGMNIQVRLESVPTRLIYNRPNLVFKPGEVFNFEALFDEVPAVQSAKLECTAILTEARSGARVARASQTIPTDPLGLPQQLRPFQIDMPSQEGAYNITLTIARVSGATGSSSRVLSRRVMQTVVVDNKGRLQQGADEPADWNLVREVRLQDLPRAGAAGEVDGKATRVLRLVGLDPERPHRVQLSANGNGNDFQIRIHREQAGTQEIRSRLVGGPAAVHDKPWQLTFWPGDRELSVRIRPTASAVNAEQAMLRIYEGAPNLEPVAIPNGRGHRIAAAYLKDSSLGGRTGVEPLKKRGSRTARDWQFYLKNVSRQTQLLNQLGYSTAIAEVSQRGAAVYPSRFLQSAAALNNDFLASSGSESPNKDVLEMIFRVYDREYMTFVPLICFDFPIARLEKRILEGDDDLRLTNEVGEVWWAANPDCGTSGPYYNPLNRSVKAQIQAVLQEISERYGHHPSFGGVGILVNEDSYLHLPSVHWGTDPSTRQAFRAGKDTPDNLQQLSESQVLDAWVAWRKQQLKELFGSLSSVVRKNNGQAHLYVLDRVLDPSPSHQQLRHDMLNSNAKGLVWGIETLQQPVGKMNAVFLSSERQTTSEDYDPCEALSTVAALDPNFLIQEFGREVSCREQIRLPTLTAFQNLPLGRFYDVEADKGNADVLVRTASSSVATYGYIVNPSPWPATIKMQLDHATESGVVLSPGKDAAQDEAGTYLAPVAPYSMRLMRVSEPNVMVTQWRTERRPEDVEKIVTRCRRLKQKTMAARKLRLNESQHPRNRDFSALDASGHVDGWEFSRGAGIEIHRIDQGDEDGFRLHMESVMPRGWPDAPIAWVRSERFPVPESGMLLIEAGYEFRHRNENTRVRLALTGQVGGKPYEEAVWISGARDEGILRLRVLRLPAHAEDYLQIRFELHGGGKVGIGSVSVYDQFFTEEELSHVQKLCDASEQSARNGNFNPFLELHDSFVATRLTEVVVEGGLPEEPKLDSVTPTETVAVVEKKETPELADETDSGIDTEQNDSPKVKELSEMIADVPEEELDTESSEEEPSIGLRERLLRFFDRKEATKAPSERRASLFESWRNRFK